MENCNHSLQDYHDKIANYDCVVCHLEQTQTILESARSQIIGMAEWLRSAGQPRVAKGAERVIDQLATVIKEIGFPSQDKAGGSGDPLG